MFASWLGDLGDELGSVTAIVGLAAGLFAAALAFLRWARRQLGEFIDEKVNGKIDCLDRKVSKVMQVFGIEED